MALKPGLRLIAVAIAVLGVLGAGVLYRVWQPASPVDSPSPAHEPITPAWSSSTSNPQYPPQIPSSSTAISANDWASLQVGEQIEFTLPSSERYVGVVTEERQGRVATSFSGNLEGDRRFHFTLTAGPSARFGTINTPVGVIEIATVGGVTWMYPRSALPGPPEGAESDVVVLEPTLVFEEPPKVMRLEVPGATTQ